MERREGSGNEGLQYGESKQQWKVSMPSLYVVKVKKSCLIMDFFMDFC
jgi:hypothetical protein